MSERLLTPHNWQSLVDLYPNLLGRYEGLRRRPTTVYELLAANLFLRGSPDYQITVNKEGREFNFVRDKHSCSLWCDLDGQTENVFVGWGSTIEGPTPKEDIVEPHLVLPPQTDSVFLNVAVPFNSDYPDVAVFGCVDGENGQKIPLAGSPESLNAQIIRGGSGKVFMWKGMEYHAISVSPEIVFQDGQPTYLKPDDLLNLSRGGVYLIVVRGKIRMKYTSPPPQPPPDVGDDGFGFNTIRKEVTLGVNGITRSYQTPASAAARVQYGRHEGTGSSCDFDFAWQTAVPVFLRLRVSRKIPPLPGTQEWVAWTNSQQEVGPRYSTVVCNYCNRQVGSEVAVIENGRLSPKSSCPGCGASSFSVVEYRRVNRD